MIALLIIAMGAPPAGTTATAQTITINGLSATANGQALTASNTN